MKSLDTNADRALFNGSLRVFTACFYENERPLQGVAGLLDWRFQGAISHHLKSGVMGGKEGECVYIPLVHGDQKYHFILIGGGNLHPRKHRGELPPESWKTLRKNLLSLNLPEVGISKSDFGNMPIHELKKHLEGVSLCLVH